MDHNILPAILNAIGIGRMPDINTNIQGGGFTPSTTAQPAPLGAPNPATGAIDGLGSQPQGPTPAQQASYSPIRLSPELQQWDARWNGGRLTQAAVGGNVQGGQMVGQNILGKDQSTSQNLLNLALNRGLTPQDSGSMEPTYMTTAQTQQGALQAGDQATQAESTNRKARAGGEASYATQEGSASGAANVFSNILQAILSQGQGQQALQTQPTNLRNAIATSQLQGKQLEGELLAQPSINRYNITRARMGADNAPRIAAATGFPGWNNAVNPFTGTPNVPPVNTMRYQMAGQNAYNTEAGKDQARIGTALSIGNAAAGQPIQSPGYAPPRTTAQPIPQGAIGVDAMGRPVFAPQQ